MEHRVVVTGVGVVSPVGTGTEAFWQALCQGRSGIGPITLFDATAYDVRFAGEVRDFDSAAFIEPREAKHMDRFVQFAVGASRMAVSNARLEITPANRDRTGVLIGSGIGGTWTWERQHQILLEKGPSRVSPYFIPMMISDMASGMVSIVFDARGPNSSVTTACASSAHAIGDAFEIIKRGDADAMIAGGAEAAVSPISVAGFCAMKALSRRNAEPEKASRPFDAGRDGFVLGEGAGIVILESLESARRRAAPILGEVVGYGMTGDAYHMTAPAPDGDGAARAMREALRDAGLEPREVDYINAHGTSTPLNDKLETVAVKRVFGDHAYRLAISSTKSMTGHTLGAAGGIECIICLLAIRDGLLPPTINYEAPDPDCDLDYVPNQARKAPVRVALSNSLGFGGHNATLVVRRFEG